MCDCASYNWEIGEFVPALRDLLAENERFRGALERIAKEPAPGSTISCRNIAKAALSDSREARDA